MYYNILSSWRTCTCCSCLSIAHWSIACSVHRSFPDKIIHRVYHFNNNIILYTLNLNDSITFILPRLLLFIMPIHCSLINIIISYNKNYKIMAMIYNCNIILYASKLIDSITFILPRLLLLIMPIYCSLINIIISYKIMAMLYYIYYN